MRSREVEQLVNACEGYSGINFGIYVSVGLVVAVLINASGHLR